MSQKEVKYSSQKSYKAKSYSRLEQRVNDLEDEGYPKISDYCFRINVLTVIDAMQVLRDKARWPKKNHKASGWKDKSNLCSCQEDFGHLTEDCFALRKEISYLLSKGH